MRGDLVGGVEAERDKEAKIALDDVNRDALIAGALPGAGLQRVVRRRRLEGTGREVDFGIDAFFGGGRQRESGDNQRCGEQSWHYPTAPLSIGRRWPQALRHVQQRSWVALDAELLHSSPIAACHRYGRNRGSQLLGDELDQGRVGLAAIGRRCHASGDDLTAVGENLPAVDSIGARSWGEADGDCEMIDCRGERRATGQIT